jgi:hypothetical protein
MIDVNTTAGDDTAVVHRSRCLVGAPVVPRQELRFAARECAGTVLLDRLTKGNRHAMPCLLDPPQKFIAMSFLARSAMPLAFGERRN